MPVDLTLASHRPRRPALTLVVQMLAIIAIAAGAIATEGTVNDSFAGSAQEVAGP